jgi:hypothetical protein
MGRGNPNWIRAAKERRALALRNEQPKELSVGGFILASLLGAAIAIVIIALARSRRGAP